MKNSLLRKGLGGPGWKMVTLLALVLLAGPAAAQPAAGTPEMADVLRQDGKIYVVVAVIAVVLAGLLVYLISLDRKLTRLEKEVHAQ